MVSQRRANVSQRQTVEARARAGVTPEHSELRLEYASGPPIGFWKSCREKLKKLASLRQARDKLATGGDLLVYSSWIPAPIGLGALSSQPRAHLRLISFASWTRDQVAWQTPNGGAVLKW